MRKLLFSRPTLVLAALCAVVTLAPAHAGPPPATQAEVVSARIVQVDADRGIVTLRHERIKSIDMGAMTMPFKVKDPAMLKALRAGDKVRFSVELQDDEPVITRIRATK